MSIQVIYIIVLAVALFIYYYRQHQKEKMAKAHEKPAPINTDGDNFLEGLADHNYFEWVDEKKLDTLCQEIKRNYERYGELSTTETNDQPDCFRLYPADEEDLFEEGGFQSILPSIQKAFQKRRLKWKTIEIHEVYENNTADQWIIINDKKYIIYDQLEGKKAHWNMASEKLKSVINDQLQLQNAEERVYSIRSGNDHHLIFLTQNQYSYLRKSNLQEADKPRPH